MRLLDIFTVPLKSLESGVFLYGNVLLSFLIGFLAVIMITQKIRSPVTFIVWLLVSGITYLILSNSRGENLAGSLPPAGFPVPPHLGLDGISLQNK